jgi:hypothetical protein
MEDAMRQAFLVVVAAAGLIGLASPAAHARCTDARVPEVRAAINAACPCTGNHGQYVSCVARAARDAMRNGDIATNCKGAITRCAARSTCGKKEGFVACAICGAGTCTDGVCDDGVTACTDSTQCPPVVNHCSTKSSAELCEAKGGTASSGSCCDATCVASPGGAFID